MTQAATQTQQAAHTAGQDPYDRLTREQLLSEVKMENRIAIDLERQLTAQKRETEKAAQDATYWSGQYTTISNKMHEETATERNKLRAELADAETTYRATVETMGDQLAAARSAWALKHNDLLKAKSQRGDLLAIVTDLHKSIVTGQAGLGWSQDFKDHINAAIAKSQPTASQGGV